MVHDTKIRDISTIKIKERIKHMADFNYQKAYCVLALPAFNSLNNNQKIAYYGLIPLVGELRQGFKDLNIPMTPTIESILNELSTHEIAEVARASYFVGHWYPGLLPKPFENKRGESWKVANCCDQILRKRLVIPHNIQIHEGKLRVTFSSKDCWMWEEFGLATEKNLRLFKECGLSFNEKYFEKSAKILTKQCGDLWPNVDNLPNNELYEQFLRLHREDEIKKLNQQKIDYLAGLRKKIDQARKEYSGYEWLIEHNIDHKNCIYYDHTDVFSFGWRELIPLDEKAELTEKLKNFPYAWEFNKIRN